MGGLTTVKVFAPATVANLGPGLDAIGLALEAPGDTVFATRVATGVTVTQVRGPFDELPAAGPENTAAVAARAVLEQLGAPFGVELVLEKGLPVGSGLGSSGASAAAAAVAVNLLAGEPLPAAALVSACARAEAAACGAAHADNVAAALIGGVVLVRSVDDVTRIETPLALFVCVVSPAVKLSTRAARAAIPAEVPLAEAVHNAAHLATLVYGLRAGDLELITKSISDRIAEPRRAPLIVGFAEVKRAAQFAGALGASISGAGPACFALCSDGTQAARVGAAMQTAMHAATGKPVRLHISPIAQHGARRIG